jgi:hypothetical protein
LTKDQLKVGGYMLAGGLLILPPITLLPGLGYLVGILFIDLMRGLGVGVKAAGKLTQDGVKKRRERQEAEAARKRREQEEANRPTPEQVRAEKLRQVEAKIAEADRVLAGMKRAAERETDEVLRTILIARAEHQHRLKLRQIEQESATL